MHLQQALGGRNTHDRKDSWADGWSVLNSIVVLSDKTTQRAMRVRAYRMHRMLQMRLARHIVPTATPLFSTERRRRRERDCPALRRPFP